MTTSRSRPRLALTIYSTAFIGAIRAASPSRNTSADSLSRTQLDAGLGCASSTAESQSPDAGVRVASGLSGDRELRRWVSVELEIGTGPFESRQQVGVAKRSREVL